jgi:hypothetical protein
MVKLRTAKAETASFRITFAMYGWVELPEIRRTRLYTPTPFGGTWGRRTSGYLQYLLQSK